MIVSMQCSKEEHGMHIQEEVLASESGDLHQDQVPRLAYKHMHTYIV